MPRLVHRLPVPRFHRPTGQARLRLAGKDYYLGKWGSPQAQEAYDRMLAEFLSRGRQAPPRLATAASGNGKSPPAGPVVGELIRDYLIHAQGYYRRADGTPTTELRNMRLALRPVRRLYGRKPVAEFGPRALKAVRQAMLDAGLCRTEINKRISRVVRMFKWGASEERIPAELYHALRTVPGLRKGRTEAREPEPVKPVPPEHVEAIRPFVTRQVWALVELQRLTGARSGELVRLRTGDLDRSDPEAWVYRPADHKTAHRGRDRTIILGPKAIEVLTPWLRADPDAYLFSPAEARAECDARRRAARKTPMTPSQRGRRPKRKPKRAPGACYRPEGLAQSIAKACRKAGVPPWHPHQLRHSVATEVRRRFGLEATQVVLGHARADVSQLYAEKNLELARSVMRQVG